MPEGESEKSRFSLDFLDEITNFVDRHVYGIRYVSYAVGAIGLIILSRNVRLTQKFTAMEDIPQRFFMTHVRLQGRVENVTSDGIVVVQHIPILASRWKKYSTHSGLPVSLTATDVLPSGVEWLQDKLQDQKVWFRLMSPTDSGHISAIITWRQSWYRRYTLVNQHLISQGLATFYFEDQLENDSLYQHLVKILNTAEISAERKGRGAWKKPTLRERILTQSGELKHKLNKSVKFWIDRLFNAFRRRRN